MAFADSWAPIGYIPGLRCVSQRRELSIMIRLTLSGTIDKSHWAHPLGRADIVVVVQYFP
jgi:hypothetical protein